LIGGNSFSATTLFAGDLKGQKNVTLVGEETGGGYYGNTAWIIPDVTLPNTGLRFRLPRFRMVVSRDRIKNGRGILPDVWALPTSEAIREGIDFKAMKVRELISQQEALTSHDPENK
jgi:C-terminal processing protease CtpA/Prc